MSLIRSFVRRAVRASTSLALALAAVAAMAQPKPNNVVELSWDPSPDPNVIGYWVYFGFESGSYPYTTFVPNGTNVTLVGLTPLETYYFVLTATEISGLESEPSNEASFHVPGGPGTKPPELSLTVDGEGTLTPDLRYYTLTPGETYSITAMPAPGFVFAGWTGDIHASNPTVSFLFEDNLTLQANFTPEPVPSANASFRGLFSEDGEPQSRSSGAFALATTSRGTYSGQVQIGRQRSSIRGRLDAAGRATNSVSLGRGTKVTVGFRLLPDNLGAGVAGRVTDGNWNSNLGADRVSKLPAGQTFPYAGSYTLTIRCADADPSLPGGDSVGAIRVNSKGTATLASTLADGERMTWSAPITDNGDWPCFGALYKGTGLIFGRLSFTNLVSAVPSPVVWRKPANATAVYYPDGFFTAAAATLAPYHRPLRKGRVLDLNSAELAFLGGELAEPRTNIVTFDESGRVTAITPDQSSFGFVTATGLFKGKWWDPSSGRSELFLGAVNQGVNGGSGTLFGKSLTSRVLLAPQSAP